jgi:NADP-dependent 3-hydroxy acid dehydrogenase YdfG
MTAGRVAMVTGASSGIGRAVAVAFGGLRWKVAIGARRDDALEETARLVIEAGGEAFPARLDVTDPHSVDAFVVRSEDALGPIDALVNNAGMAVPGPFWELAPDDLGREVSTNLLGPMFCTRRVLLSMIARGRGDVVFVSSDTAQAPRPGMIGYGATKAGVEHLARSLKLELEGRGVRITTVRVGPTKTDFGNSWAPDRVAGLMATWPRFGIQRHFEALDPADVARAVVYAVTSPPGVHVDLLEVQPEAPKE